MNYRKGLCEVGTGSGNYQPHQWMLESTARYGGVIKRTWYCTRCREFETTSNQSAGGETGDAT